MILCIDIFYKVTYFRIKQYEQTAFCCLNDLKKMSSKISSKTYDAAGCTLEAHNTSEVHGTARGTFEVHNMAGVSPEANVMTGGYIRGMQI